MADGPGNPNILEVGMAYRFPPGVSGNPAGRTKGSKNFSTRIRKLVENDKAVIQLENGKYLKNPGKLIVEAMSIKAQRGDVAAATWLAKYGYGDKQDITSNGESLNTTPLQVSSEIASDFASYLMNKTKVVIEGEIVEPPMSHNVTEGDEAHGE